jgi:GNAT superfamily N-acetyltransferase
MTRIAVAESEPEILACGPVMRQLRPHLVADDFVATIRRQQASGYVLAYLAVDSDVRAVAGFRIIDNLIARRLLYVDDLVTADGHRSQGHGEVLLEWLAARARSEGCTYLELDCGVQRFDSHRFYMRNKLILTAHHFSLKL